MAQVSRDPAKSIFAIRPVGNLVEETHESGHELKRAVSSTQLTAMGVGAIIGTGIFVVVGEGAGVAGPAVILSFVLAAVACVFSALSYAELASSIPVAGSAYTYTYATLGEVVAWIIGWDLILEYGVSVAAVAVGWGANLNAFLDSAFGVEIPQALATSPENGGVFNLPAVLVVLAITALLVRGTQESARANLVMVVVKLAALAFFIVVALSAFSTRELHAVRSGRCQRRRQRGRDHLLRLHRLRRRVDRQRGGAQPRPRPADRDHRVAGDLHGLLHPHRRRRDRHRHPGTTRARARRPWRRPSRRARGSRGLPRCSPSVRSSRSPA